jgi:hypothetical protein
MLDVRVQGQKSLKTAFEGKREETTTDACTVLRVGPDEGQKELENQPGPNDPDDKSKDDTQVTISTIASGGPVHSMIFYFDVASLGWRT